MIVASHGNDLPDILLTFLASKRDLLFVANIAAADSPAVRWTYAGLGVIPVSRVRDARALKARGEDASAINANAFVRVVDALRQGHCVAIFPEGVVPDQPRIGALRNGAARMALQALDEGVPLTMVPVGYQYESAHEPRSGALCVVGDAISVNAWTPGNAARRVSEFTDFICDRLREVTRNARTHDDAERLAYIAAAAGAALSGPTENPMIAAHRVQRKLSCLSAANQIFEVGSIANGESGQREHLRQFTSAALALSNAATLFGARAWSAGDIAQVLSAAHDDPQTRDKTNTGLLRWLLLSPVAAFGWLWHAIPWWASYKLGKRLAPRRAEIAALTLVPGLYIMALWYIVAPLLLFALGVSAWYVVLIFVAQPRAGDIAMRWRDEWRLMRSAARVRKAPESARQSLREQGALLRERWKSFA